MTTPSEPPARQRRIALTVDPRDIIVWLLILLGQAVICVSVAELSATWWGVLAAGPFLLLDAFLFDDEPANTGGST